MVQTLRRQPYRVFMADQRLWIPAKRIYTYPDVMLVAEPLAYAPDRLDTLTNPLMIAEVLSEGAQTMLKLSCIPFEIELVDLYDKVAFEENEDEEIKDLTGPLE